MHIDMEENVHSKLNNTQYQQQHNKKYPSNHV